MMVGVVALVAAACSSNSDTATPTTFTAAPTTTTTAAPAPEVNAAVTVTYDGSDCVYDGPDELDEGPLEINFVNDSDDDVGLHTARLNQGIVYTKYQQDMESNADLNPISNTILWLNRDNEGLGNRGELSESVAVLEGLHALTCVGWIASDGPPDLHIHVSTIPVG